jgi:hypothetical protein
MLIRSAAGDMEWSRGEPEELIQTIQQTISTLFEQGQIIQEIHIDNQVFREDYEEYITRQADIGTINEIVIVSVEEKSLIKDIETDLKAYLPKLLNGLDSISELLYGQMSEEDWSHFTRLVEGIQWFTSAAQVLRHHLQRQGQPSSVLDALVEFENGALQLIAQLNESLEQQEFTHAGDLLKYEWPELLLPVQEALKDGDLA